MLRDDDRPVPFRPCDIRYRLGRVEGEHAGHVGRTVVDPEARLRAHPLGAKWLACWEDRVLGSRFQWDGPSSHLSWRALPAKLLAEVFTFEERARIWHDSVIMSELSRTMEEQETLLWKVSNSSWQYGMGHDWNTLVEHVDGLRALSCDLDGFDVRLAHTTKYNPFGWSEHEIDGQRIYLDGMFGLLLDYKGKHALTVSFSPSAEGILVAQAQLREPKGNRFLYRLPQHYLDVALDTLGRAFGHDKLALVTGKSAATAAVAAYAHGPTEPPKGQTLDRLRAFYDRPLAAFVRGKSVGQWHGRTFLRLVPAGPRRATGTDG